MKNETKAILDTLLDTRPALKTCGEDIERAFALIAGSFRNGGKLLACGNGGSAADAEHIVGELMKGFKLPRPISPADREKLTGLFGPDGEYLAARLQRALPAISLAGHCALSTAFANDVAADLCFAQQVYGFARPGDTLLCISTSGNAANVAYAAMTAKSLGAGTVALTGEGGGRLMGLCDVTIRVPAKETYLVQELHLPVYHALCAMLEQEFFGC